MNVSTTTIQGVHQNRLLSLDFFRGFTMFLLIGEFTGLFELLHEPSIDSSWLQAIGNQFHHHPWNGLRFWDLVQPFFMFIVGVAIPYSERKRLARGDTHQSVMRHAIQRSLLLLILGWALYCIGPGHITFRFQNVLAQLSVTYLVSFLLRNKSFTVQLLVSILCLLLTELLYRSFWVPGFDQPFVPDKNIGAYVDLLLSGELSGGHWVSLNALPTTAHTIWGVMVGRLLLAKKPITQTLLWLVVPALVAILLGYLLDPVTPIVKRISTTTFVLVSGGWTILAFTLCYWIIDIKGYRGAVKVFAIVGMNSLAIYLFAHVGGADLVYQIVKPFSFALFAGLDEWSTQVITSIVVWFLLWYLCYWLYRRRIFLKI